MLSNPFEEHSSGKVMNSLAFAQYEIVDWLDSGQEIRLAHDTQPQTFISNLGIYIADPISFL